MKEYCIGLDIGTSSVGWAMTDPSGQLLKYHQRSTYGATLFEEAQTAADRRKNRSTRRRLDRKEQRIDWLQELMGPDVCAVDPDFFHRLNEAFLQQNERLYASLYSSMPRSLYLDGAIRTGAGESEAPTIYHIRRLLATGEKQADIRYVYLAIHHIIKYRGHFLIVGEDVGSLNGEAPEAVCQELMELLTDPERFNLALGPVDAQALCNVLRREARGKALQTEIQPLLKANKAGEKAATALSCLLAGMEGSLKDLLGFEGEEGANQKDKSAINAKLSLASGDWDMEAYQAAMTEDQAEAFGKIVQLYQWQVFSAFTRDGKTLSDEMVERYEQHKRDLKQLKAWVRRYLTREEYDDLFRNDQAKEGYCAYSRHLHAPDALKLEKLERCKQEDFYKHLKKLLESVKTPQAEAEAHPMLEAMEQPNGFLPLQRINLNGAIPNQMHMQELKLILDKQGVYYPTLREHREKILSLCTFRLPYYVGPLNKNSPFQKWLVRREQDAPVRPWNFEQAVDTIRTAEGFVRNLTNKCTYLPTEDVLPLHSLLYEEYLLLDELNRVQVKGQLLNAEVKRRAMDELFARRKSVSCQSFANWLTQQGLYQNLTGSDITGTHEEGKFAASLRTRYDLERIGLTVAQNNQSMLEELVRWSTVFEDRKIFHALMTEKYPQLTEEQKNRLCRKRYTGWGRLSGMLLDGLMGEGGLTLMDVLRQGNENLMMALHNRKYQFEQRIRERLCAPEDDPITYEEVKELAVSPALRRGVWIAVRIVEELIAHQGALPRAIYLENTREPGSAKKGKRTRSRVEQLKQIYQASDVEIPSECQARLKRLKSSDTLDDRQFLYFLQLGKCLYTQQPLNFDLLSSTTQIDHILPQCYVMDDSIENRALVLTAQNQRKRDSLLLSDEIRRSQGNWWRCLRSKGLMGDKKLHNLLRDHVTADELDRFAARQLVETSQIIQHVTALFRRHYPQVAVYGINARLSTALRSQYGLIKLRELNDLHHAYDAFLACMLGTFMQRHLNWLIDENVRQIKNRERWMDAQQKDKYGLVISAFNRDQIDRETGEVLRSAQKEIAYLKAVWGYHDGHVVFKKYEGSGEFFNESRYRAGSTSAKIPLRKNLPCERYGGFSSVNPAYIAAISYLQKDKRGKKTQKEELVNVPIYLAKKIEQDPSELIRYLEREYGYSEIQVIRPKIMLNQQIEYEGGELLLRSCSEVRSACELFLPMQYHALLDRVLHAPQQVTGAEEETVDELIALLQEKLGKYYPIYSGVAKRLEEAKEKIKLLSLEEKCVFVRETLKVMSTSSQYGMYKSALPGLGLSNNQGRITNKVLYLRSITLIDQSITGLREKRKKLWPDSEQS